MTRMADGATLRGMDTSALPTIPQRVEKRLWRRFPESLLTRLAPQENGCVLFTGSLTPKGYGQVWVDGRLTATHRAMYEVMIGPIPEGMELDHTCHTADRSCLGGDDCPHRPCCNPGHLEPVTRRENAQRGRAGEVNAARMLARTHCVNDHPFDEANTYVHPVTGYRSCRRCKQDRKRQARARAAYRADVLGS